MNQFKIIIIVLLIFSPIDTIYSQTVSLNFPHFKNQGWWYRVPQGEKMDTIAKGSLDEHGRVRIQLPESHKNYRGMTQWVLTLGGGLDIIVSGDERIAVECPDANPAEGGIKYNNTVENDFLFERYRRQQTIFQRIDALRAVSQAYDEDGKLSPVFTQELAKQMEEYQVLQKETRESKLYSARFAEIVDITRGYGKSLSQDADVTSTEIRDFIVNDLDLSDLYTSGHWAVVLAEWLNSYALIKGTEQEIDKQLIDNYNNIAKRTTNQSVKDAFSETIKRLLSDNGKADLAKMLDIMGLQAPDFLINETTKLSDLKGKRLLFFYGSFCDLCQDQLLTLKREYTSLKKQGITVIGIDSESTKSTPQPWSYDVADDRFEIYQQFKLEQTPVYILVDEQGIVSKRGSKLDEIMK